MSQNYDIFIWDTAFFQQNVARLNGFSNWISSFLIQFFYLPAAGGLILALLLSGIQILISRLFRLDGYSYFLSFLPSLGLMCAVTQVNYYLFEAFDVSFLFGIIPAFFVMMSIVATFCRMSKPLVRLTFFIAVTFLLYPAFGFFALFAALLCLLKEFTLTADSRRILRCEIMLLALLVVPLCWFPVFSSSNVFSRFYISGLVEENVIEKDIATQVFFYLPFWFGFVLCAILALREPVCFKVIQQPAPTDLNHPVAGENVPAACHSAERESSQTDEKAGKPPRLRKKAKSKKSRLSPEEKPAPGTVRPSRLQVLHRRGVQEAVSGALIAGFCMLTVAGSFYQPNFRVLLKVGRLLEENRWEEILEQEEKVPFPVNPLISARTLSLLKTDQLSSRMFERPCHPKESVQLGKVGSFKMLGDRILFHYGYFNLANRAAMNNFTDKNERSLWAVKTLALCAVGNGESQLADKYLQHIEKTLFHKKWAERHREYLRRQNAADDSALDTSPIAEEFRHLREIGIHEDYISNVMTLDYVVFLGFQEQNFERRSLAQRENQLLFLLFLQDRERFFKYLKPYLESRDGRPVPVYFQEAVLLYSHFLPQFGFDAALCPIAPETQRRFGQFLAMTQELQKLPPQVREGELFSRLERDFRNTYWYHQIANTQLANY